MKKTIGILAHVDAGKTTFSEQLLYHTGSVRTRGRVDHGDSFLDSNGLERRRGITVFSGLARFSCGESEYFLLDTPGHVDFSSEMERVLRVLDYAVILVSCVEGVQAHTETIWRLLAAYGVPAFFFFNKTDRAGADYAAALEQARRRLSADLCDFSGYDGVVPEPVMEFAADRDDALLERYLAQDGDPLAWRRGLRTLIRERSLFPCLCGSALQDTGVELFLRALEDLTETSYCPDGPFRARIYQIRHDARGGRLAFLKVLSGVLEAKMETRAGKANEIRLYHGSAYVPAARVEAGGICAVTGLSAGAGTLVYAADASAPDREPGGQARVIPMLSARVQYAATLPDREALRVFRLLEEEDPALSVSWDESLRELSVRVMGEIQLEILRELVQERFGMTVSFGACEVLYRETVAAPVMGYGHFEPLRHYAEVHLRLSPGPRGSGVVFDSACPTDVLEAHYQNLIRTHVLEKEHRGVLTGAPLTDVRVTLVTGRAHLRHTEGGDFREAVYRAIRQGLARAESVLLEPWCAFRAEVPLAAAGRVISDIQKRGGVAQGPLPEGDAAVIYGRGPAGNFLTCARELASFTGGRGVFFSRFDGYEPCERASEVIAARGYRFERDTDNPADSVFCSHGAGYTVPWREVPTHVHCRQTLRKENMDGTDSNI